MKIYSITSKSSMNQCLVPYSHGSDLSPLVTGVGNGRDLPFSSVSPERSVPLSTDSCLQATKVTVADLLPSCLPCVSPHLNGADTSIWDQRWLCNTSLLSAGGSYVRYKSKHSPSRVTKVSHKWAPELRIATCRKYEAERED